MSSVRLMVLGVLSASSQLHGYSIYRSLQTWRADTWTNIKPGSVYHALTYLEKHAFIEYKGVKAKSSGPSATIYSINDAGRTELLRLTKSALVSYDQEVFSAGLAWMHILPRATVLGLAKQRLRQYEQTCAFMRALPREDMPDSPDKHPEILDSWTVLFDATARWLKTFIIHIDKGYYRFDGE